MLTLDQIRARLRDSSPMKVSKACGVHYQTIRAIRDGVNANPTWRSVKALSDYLESVVEES